MSNDNGGRRGGFSGFGAGPRAWLFSNFSTEVALPLQISTVKTTISLAQLLAAMFLALLWGPSTIVYGTGAAIVWASSYWARKKRVAPVWLWLVWIGTTTILLVAWVWLGPELISLVWFDFAIPLPIPWKVVITLIVSVVVLSQGDLLRKLALNLWDETWPHAEREPGRDPYLPPDKQYIWEGRVLPATIDAQAVEPVPAGTTIVINGQLLDMPMPIPAGGEGVRAQFFRAYMSKLTNFSRGSKTKKGAMYYGFTRSEFDILQDWFQDQGLLDETDQGGWEPTSKGKRIMQGVIRAHYLDTREDK